MPGIESGDKVGCQISSAIVDSHHGRKLSSKCWESYKLNSAQCPNVVSRIGARNQDIGSRAAIMWRAKAGIGKDFEYAVVSRLIISKILARIESAFAVNDHVNAIDAKALDDPWDAVNRIIKGQAVVGYKRSWQLN